MVQSDVHDRIGIVGSGLMGTAIGSKLIEDGRRLSHFDLMPEQGNPLTVLGSRPAILVEDLVRDSDILIYSVMTSAQVRASIQSCARQLTPRHLIIDTSTGDPDEVVEIADELKSLGIAYLDATIAGSSREVREATALALVGGDARAFHRASPVLSVFCRKLFHLGGNGSGSRMKLAFNMALGLHRAVLAETLGFAKKTGLDLNQTLEVLKEGAAYSRVMDSKGEKMLSGDFTPQARLRQHLKDVELMLKQGDSISAYLPLTGTHKALLEKTVAEGFGDLDNSAMVKLFLGSDLKEE